MSMCEVLLASISVLIIVMLFRKVSGLKKEIRRICQWLQEGDHIYCVNFYDKDIEDLAVSVNERISEESKRKHKIEKQDKKFKRMVANLSHDLRTPLTVIIGYLQLIDFDESISGTSKEYIKRIEAKTAYLKRLIDDLYMLFWSEAIDDEIEWESVELTKISATLLKEYIQNSNKAAEQLDISLSKSPIYICGNEKVIIRILCNLVDNALKYSTGNIYFSIQESEGICCIIVENFAREIGERELNDIFELFYTEDKARNSNGMGLYITKKLVKQLGGEISASYEGGKFRIHIELQAELQATTI